MSKDDNIAATKARFDRFNVDLSSGTLQRSGLNVPIQAQPFHVLRRLLIANGRVVSRDELRSALWPDDTFVDFEHSLNTAMRKLRQALEDSVENPKFVETFPRLGYRFIASVEWAPAEATRAKINNSLVKSWQNLRLRLGQSSRCSKQVEGSLQS